VSRVRSLGATLLVLGALLPGVASAQSDSREDVWKEAPRPELPPVSLRRIATVGVQLDVNYQFNPIVKQIYDRNGPFALSVWGNLLFDERVGIGITAGLQRRVGTGVAPSDETPPEVVLWQIPIAVEGWLRLALWRDQPVVPYMRAGAGVLLVVENLFAGAAEGEEADPAAEPEDDEAETTKRRKPIEVEPTRKFTLHAGGGVQIRLPFPELQWEGGMTGPSAMSDIYLHIEAWARVANNFAEYADLSAVGASAGLTVMF